MGCSSGGAAALTMGWFRPDLFRRIIAYSGTFVDQQDDDAPEEAKYPLGAWEYHSGMKLIETSEKKPLRIFTHVSENDLRPKIPRKPITTGSWPASAPQRRSRPKGTITASSSPWPPAIVTGVFSIRPWPTRSCGSGAGIMRIDLKPPTQAGCWAGPTKLEIKFQIEVPRKRVGRSFPLTPALSHPMGHPMGEGARRLSTGLPGKLRKPRVDEWRF